MRCSPKTNFLAAPLAAWQIRGMNVAEQIKAGAVVCPRTHTSLTIDDNGVHGGSVRYHMVGNTPILLSNPEMAGQYADASPVMNEEYGDKRLSLGQKARRWLRKGTQTKASRDALAKVINEAEGVCLSIGGGPLRHHEKLTNLNIGPFPNVDIVGDAHELPYADASVAAVHSEAVFEHLADPNKAAAELARILKPGAMAFIATPFLQAYHGYPHHYQNFTITGHAALFERAGLNVIERGVQVGPTYALLAMVSVYLRTYAPRPLKPIFMALWAPFILLLKPLDKFIGENGHVMACTTYLVAQKPG